MFHFRGENIVIGVCLPMATVEMDVASMFTMDDNWKDSSEIIETDSLANLESDPAANVFFDRTKG